MIHAIVLAVAAAFPVEEPLQLKTPTGVIAGTLLTPTSAKPVPLVLLIAGSGPTDRNGNSAMLPGPNNSLKLLAEGLAAHGIASARYDKRGIAASAGAMGAEKDLRFDSYIDDAAAFVKMLARDARFSGVIIAGHSEGALIGTVAAQKSPVIGFVSIAGAGRAADVILHAQLDSSLPPDLAARSDSILRALKSGTTVADVPQQLAMFYRPSVQPYLISWFRYDPAAELRKLAVPVLIVQGTTDAQMSLDDARTLAAAKSDAKLEIIEGMNHVLKLVPADPEKQSASYGDPSLPVAPRLVEVIAAFVEAAARTAH